MSTYHRNPLLMTVMGNPGRERLRPKSVKIFCAMCGEWDKRKGPYRMVRTRRAGWIKGNRICADCYSGMRTAMARGFRAPAAPRYKPNPFILVDSKTLKVIRNWKGSMLDRKPWEWAREAARRLDRNVFVVAHPYVPQGFRAGVEVSPLFFSGGPFQVVFPDGGSRQASYADLPPQHNPGIVPSIVGGMVGALTTHALSNPGSGPADEHAARELQLFIDNDSTLYHQQFIPIVKNLMKKRMRGVYDSDRAVKLFMYLADAGAKKYVQEFGTAGQRVDTMFNRNTRLEVARSLRDGFEAEASLGNYDKLTWGVSNNPDENPLTSDESAEILGLARSHLAYGSQFRPGFTRSETAGQAMAMGHIVRSYGPKRAERAGVRMMQRAKRVAGTEFSSNPGPGRRTKTIPIEQFAKMVKAQRDPSLWRDFVAKCKAYYKWSHGTWPTKVTVERVRKAGMRGLWITFDMGKEPEKTYIMPRGTKRKGAWKHPWERMPEIRGDAEAGIIITKLRKGNRLTDFLHG